MLTHTGLFPLENVLKILLWVIRFQILIVRFTISSRYIKTPSLIPFSNNKYMSVSGKSSSSPFGILSTASQLRASALKK